MFQDERFDRKRRIISVYIDSMALFGRLCIETLDKHRLSLVIHQVDV